MDPEQLRESEIDAIADRVAKQLPTGQYGDKFVFSRRQVMALAASGLSVGALTTLGVDEATAQDAVGAVGTDTDRVDVFANDVTAAGDVSASAVETDYSDSEADDGNRVQAAGDDSKLDPVFGNGDKGLLSLKQAEMRQDGVTSDPSGGEHLYALAIDTPSNADTTNAVNLVYAGGESAIGISMNDSNSRSGIQFEKFGSFTGPMVEFGDPDDVGGPDISKKGGKPVAFDGPLSFLSTGFDVNAQGNNVQVAVDTSNSSAGAQFRLYRDGELGGGNETEWIRFREQDSNNYVEVWAHGNEVMRIRDNGDLDISGSVNENAF